MFLPWCRQADVSPQKPVCSFTGKLQRNRLVESQPSIPERNVADGSLARVRGTLSLLPSGRRGDPKRQGGLESRPCLGGRRIPSQPLLPSQVHLQNRYETLELDNQADDSKGEVYPGVCPEQVSQPDTLQQWSKKPKFHQWHQPLSHVLIRWVLLFFSSFLPFGKGFLHWM